MTSAVAKRYAKALFALAGEAGSFEATGGELRPLAAAFGEPGLRSVAESTTLDRRARKALATRVARHLGLSPLLANFFGVLAENNRLRALAAIGREYERLEDRRVGRIRARLRSARSLPDDDQLRIRETLERRTGKEVVAEALVDPALLGGVVVEMQGRVFDGSVRMRLERLRQSLSG